MNIESTPLLTLLPKSAALYCVRSQRYWTLDDIHAEVTARIARFAAMGLARGAWVAIGHEDAIDYLLELFSAWAYGLCAVAVNPRLPDEERSNLCQNIPVDAWLGTHDFCLSQRRTSQTNNRTSPDLAPPALIMMSSGTTGRPKGIAHTFGSLRARTALNIAEIGVPSLERSLCVLPVHFGHGLIGNCLTPLLAGGTLHVWSSPDLSELRVLGEVIDRYKITFMSSVPSFWRLAMRVSPRPHKPMRRVHIGSAPLSRDQWHTIADWTGTQSVFNMYGMTETANWIGGGALSEARGRDGFVGRCWGGALRVLNAKGVMVEKGEGEVLIQSPSMMAGYWDDPDSTRAAFLDGWFRTGDIGQLDKQGALTLVGRIKSEINYAGIKIQAEEIDILLERHPDIIEACAFSLPDVVAGECVAAAVVMAEGVQMDAETIKAWCRARVRAEAVPVHLFALPQLPRNDRGKLQRAEAQSAIKRLLSEQKS